MAKKTTAPWYKTVITRLDGLTIVDHSAKFESIPWQETKSTPNSVSATFNYQPGSRRLVEYKAGKACLSTEIVDAHDQGNDRSSAELVWDSRITPIELPKIALGILPSDQAWEYVDFTKFPDKVRFAKLTQRLARKLETTGDPVLQRLNADDISVLALDVNGQNELSKPEIVIIHTLGATSVQPLVEQFMEQTVHPDLQPHLETIMTMELEIFSKLSVV